MKAIPLVLCALGVWLLLPANAAGCSESARLLRYACSFDVRDDFHEASAVCHDNSVPDSECFDGAAEERGEGIDECNEVFDARLELCDALEDAAHEPEFGPEFAGNFVNPLLIGNGVAPNPYLPLVQGNQWVYEGTFLDDDGEMVTETITVTVTDKTKLSHGITCLVVNDIAEEDEQLIESTDDWFAQDVDGNVWYCGEISGEFETFDGDDPETPELVETEGSWKAGRDGAKAGILLPRVPTPGDIIRQEVAFGDAEDAVEIVSTSASESAPAAACSGNCLQTRDFTPLEPDANEHKYYAPGIGLIVEIDLDSGERVELIQAPGGGS